MIEVIIAVVAATAGAIAASLFLRAQMRGTFQAVAAEALNNNRAAFLDLAKTSFEGLQQSVYDIDAARADLVARGVDVSEPFHDATGIFHHAGAEGRVNGPAPRHADYGSFVAFSDPDGNGWLLQEIKTRLPGR